MFDDSLRLRENPHLLSLLSHYAQMGTEDRATWRDRLMQMEGVEPKRLSALHGELIAFDWVEQNTGQALMLANGTLSACYRITMNGLREYRRIHGVEIEVEAPEKSQSRFSRKKKEKAEVLAVAAPEELLIHGEKIEVERASEKAEVLAVAPSEESLVQGVAIEQAEAPEKSQPRFPRKKKQKSDSPVALAVVAPQDSLIHGEKIEEERSEKPEKSQPRFPRKKKQKGDSPEAIAVAASDESLVLTS